MVRPLKKTLFYVCLSPYYMGSRKKRVLLLMAGPLMAGGVKDRAIKEKLFLELFFPNVPTAIKLEGSGGGVRP